MYTEYVTLYHSETGSVFLHCFLDVFLYTFLASFFFSIETCWLNYNNWTLFNVCSSLPVERYLGSKKNQIIENR